MAAEFPHFSAFRPVTSAVLTLPESSAAAATEMLTETGCAEVSTTVDKVENEELSAAVVDDSGEKGKGD